MLSECFIAKKYSEALFEAANEEKALAFVQHDLDSLKDLVSDTEVNKFFLKIDKFHELENVLLSFLKEEKFNVLTNNFLRLLLENKRMYLLKDIIDGFYDLMLQSDNMHCVSVESAKDLSNDDQNYITNLMNKYSSGKNLYFKFIKNPSIIYGVRINFGSKVLDFSFHSMIEKFA